jgi:4-hydroxybenzoate polyprenyltransferase
MDIAALPYNMELLTWLGEQKAQGRRMVLATASPRLLADQIAEHLGLFDEVLATDAGVNLRSGAKRDALVSRFGERGFDYIGNDWADVQVWRSAAQSHVMSRSARLIQTVRNHGNLGQVMDDGKPATVWALLKAMRPHQWMKNLLVFVPLLAAHQYGASANVLLSLLAFVVFGLAASSVYLLNDLVDVTADRNHLRKRARPFAAGNLPLVYGWVAWPLLLGAAFSLAGLFLPWPFTAALGVYFVFTFAYSLRLKQVPVVDVLVLAGLYTMRIVAGAAAIGVALSFWLLSFSMFVFLSLALMKRYSELRAARATGHYISLRGRGYESQDLELVSSLGASAGNTAVLLLALYVQDGQTARLYSTPTFIWLACPLLLFWISRAWLITHRGNMHDDPVLFALKDRVSWAVAALIAVLFVLATVVP